MQYGLVVPGDGDAGPLPGMKREGSEGGGEGTFIFIRECGTVNELPPPLSKVSGTKLQLWREFVGSFPRG